MQIRDRSSLASCDDRYSNMYSIGRHPEFKPPTISSTQPIHKDTLQISQEELKKEALKRLRHTSKYLIFQHGFMRIGKYLFLAVAFPPYLVAYKIPRWILVEGFPQIFSFFGSITGKIALPFKQRIDLFVQKITRVIQQIQGTMRGLIQPLVKIGLAFRYGLRRMRQRIVTIFNGMNERTKRVLSAPKRVFSEISQVFEQAQKGFIKAQQWIVNQVGILWTPVQGSMNWLKNFPKQLKLQKLQAFKERSWASISKHFIAKYQEAQQMTIHITNWIAQRWQSYARKLSFVGQQISKAYRLLQPHLKRTRAWFNHSREFLSKKHQQFLNWIQKKKKKIQDLSAKQILASFSTLTFFAWIPEPIRRLLKLIFWNKGIQKVIHSLIKISIFILSYFFKGLEGCLQALESSFQFLSKMTSMVMSFIMSGITTCISYPLGLFTFFSKMCYKGFYGLLVFLVMISILFVWGIRLLGPTSHRLVSLWKNPVKE